MKLVRIVVENIHKTSDEERSTYWTPPCLVACRIIVYNLSSTQNSVGWCVEVHQLCVGCLCTNDPVKQLGAARTRPRVPSVRPSVRHTGGSVKNGLS